MENNCRTNGTCCISAQDGNSTQLKSFFERQDSIYAGLDNSGSLSGKIQRLSQKVKEMIIGQ
jgi:hypothetical protein